MMQRVGTCSICGGDVMGYRGVWWGVMLQRSGGKPPPRDACSKCGAVRADDIIQMARPMERGLGEYRLREGETTAG